MEPLKLTENVLTLITTTSLGFVAGAIKVLADGNTRTLPMALAAILGGGLFAFACGAIMLMYFHIDPLIVAACSGLLGAAGDHVIVALSTLAEPWRKKPKDAVKDLKNLINGKGEENV